MNNGTSPEKKQEHGKPHAFSVINAVRDMCKQPDGKKLLMFTLATYCDRDGICYPGNRTLAAATGKSERTIQRMLPSLAKDGELEILTPGIGRDQKRIIRLKRYVVKPDKAMADLNTTRLPMKSVLEQPPLNSHEQPPKISARVPAHTRPRETRATPKLSLEDLEKARWHRKKRTKPWRRFESYCHESDGTPRLTGFHTWWSKIKIAAETRAPYKNQFVEHLDTEHLKHLSDEERADRSRRRARVRYEEVL